jgi:phosphoglycolate phosphatase
LNAAAITHLIFDLDGTLTDPREGITRCYIHALRELGREAPPPTALERYIGPPTREVLSDLLGTLDKDEIERAVSIYRQRFSTLGLFENVPYPGIGEALRHFGQTGLECWVCTSKPGVYATRILVHFELSGYFRAIYGCELDGTRADKADLLAYLLARESISADQALMIGDRMHDVRAARSNGLRSIGVLYGFGDRAELQAAGADALCASPTELPTIVARIAATVQRSDPSDC